MSETIYVRHARHRVNPSVGITRRAPRIFTPGEVITERKEFMRGHGTYENDGLLKSSIAGVKEQINNLISVRPLKWRYSGDVGDVVVGRIKQVQKKRWKVNTNSRLDSVLLLSSVNLPGGELRRRSSEDEYKMRDLLQEGDLISAEVQSVFSDGTLSLHTRSFKYGKLSQGILLKVFPSLIKRSKTHFHDLFMGISIILGKNGYIWIFPTSNPEETLGGFAQNLEEIIPKTEREIMCRLRNCILALTNSKMMLYDTSILYAFEESQKYSVAELLVPEAMVDVAILTQDRLFMSEES